MSGVATIAVIGGGPAGAMFASRFLTGWQEAIRGRRPGVGPQPPRVLVFEEKRGWEKPCGGGLTWKALARYPFLAEASAPGNRANEMEVAVAGDHKIRFRLRKPIAIYARRDLNALLLRRADEAGAAVTEDRIARLTPVDDAWRLEGLRETYAADFVVVAAGARTRLRNPLAGNLPARDFMLTCGYYVPQPDPVLRIECFRNFDGYAWSFPRPGHLSVGICGKAGECSMPQLKQMLHDFMQRHGYLRDGAPIFAHLLPSLSARSWRSLSIEGRGWALAGDAAGFVDPITGEGIYFAMRSGELLAESLLAAASASANREPLTPADYSRRVREEFANALLMGARASPYFYHWNFMGDATTVRLVQLAERSRAFMNLLQDMIEGRETYSGLKRRIGLALPKAALEVAAKVTEERLRGCPRRAIPSG